MALNFYHDYECTIPITSENPDKYRASGVEGTTLIEEKKIYIKSDDSNLTYENILITAVNDSNDSEIGGEIDIKYAIDNSGTPGTYMDNLNIDNQDLVSPITVWRKVIAPNIAAAFNKTDIQHKIENYEQYVK